MTQNLKIQAMLRSLKDDDDLEFIDNNQLARLYLNGKRHRTDGPALIICNDGTREWYLNGKRHRTDGPALIANGNNYWYFNDELHRVDGPAIITMHGDQEWYLNGKRHRTDGPAIEYLDLAGSYYLNGKQVTEYEHMMLVNN